MLCSQKVKACSYTIRQLSFQVTYKGQAMNLCSLLPAGTLECSNGITAGVTIKSFSWAMFRPGSLAWWRLFTNQTRPWLQSSKETLSYRLYI